MRAPAPWDLQGRGLILPLWLPARRVGALAGAAGPGAVMWVDYRASGVGPYGELLLARQVHTPTGRWPHVPQIVVDSEASVENGRENWAIPKTLAALRWEVEGARTRVQVEDEGGPLGAVEVEAWGPSLPVGLGWLPARWRTLFQPRGTETLRTTVSGSGRVRPGRLRSVELPVDRWPDLLGARVLGAIVVQDFDLRFPEAARG